MIDWGAVKDAAKALVVDLTGLGPRAVRWADEPEGGTWANTPTITLAITSPRELGYGEERRDDAEEDDDADDQIVIVVAQKVFTLTLRCESFNQDIRNRQHAGALLTTLETRLSRTSTIERLYRIFAITDSTSPREISYVDKDRQVSAYVMDLFCATVDNDEDDTAGAGGTIEEIEISGTIQDGAIARPVAIDVKGS